MKAEVVQEVRNGEDVTLRCEETLSDEEWKTQFQAVHLRSDFDQIGWIETGDQKVNQLFSNALWGQKGNFLDLSLIHILKWTKCESIIHVIYNRTSIKVEI